MSQLWAGPVGVSQAHFQVKGQTHLCILEFESPALLSPRRKSINRKRGGGDGLGGRGSEPVGEDDAVPGLVGRGHSSAAIHHEKGQLRTGTRPCPPHPATEGAGETVRGETVDRCYSEPLRWHVRLERLSRAQRRRRPVRCTSLHASDRTQRSARDVRDRVATPPHQWCVGSGTFSSLYRV